tara:strand:- start:430 stop:1551 length:1122 start_codon:yes stop_codon:yes gene_type:complete
MRSLLSIYIFLIFTTTSYAEVQVRENLDLSDINNIINVNIYENYEFSGLASFYNNINLYLLDKDNISLLESGYLSLKEEEWLIIAGRYNILAINGNDLEVNLKIENNRKILNSISYSKQENFITLLGNKKELSEYDYIFKKINYAHLIFPLKNISYLFEVLLRSIQELFQISWVIMVFLFALIIKIVFIPVTLLTNKIQKKVNYLKSKIEPNIKTIKNNFEGEKAHTQILDIYKMYKVTPFYTLKPIIGTLIQIPFLICIFNVLGEIDEFRFVSFLWIKSLAYPDSIMTLPINLFFFGNQISILPFFMCFIIIFSIYFYKTQYLTHKQVRSQRINNSVMALCLFFLFYPFPAAMVLYWSLSNVIDMILQKIIK